MIFGGVRHLSLPHTLSQVKAKAESAIMKYIFRRGPIRQKEGSAEHAFC